MKTPILGYFRIGTACILLLTLLSLEDDFLLLYTPNGLVDAPLLELKHLSPTVTLNQIIKWLSHHFNLDGLSVFTLLYVLYIQLCICLVLGIHTKFTSLFLLLLHISIFTSLTQYSYGADYFCNILLFYCLVFPTDRSSSIDQLILRLPRVSEKQLSLCLGVLRTHLCLVYFFSGLDKALGGDWWNGQALWKALHLPYFQEQNLLGSLLPYSPSSLFVTAGAAVVLLEFSYPLSLFVPRLRNAIVYSMLVLHLLIALTMGLYFFSLVMIFLNIISWLTGNPSQRYSTRLFTPYLRRLARPKPPRLVEKGKSSRKEEQL